jgi:hypothetical protein
MSLIKKINQLFKAPSLNLYNILGFVLGFLFLFIIGFKLYLSLEGRYLGFMLGFVLSGLISFFVLDKFNYSENLIIRLLQKAVYLSILIILGIFIYFIVVIFLDLIPTIDCSSIEDSVKISSTSSNNVNNASAIKEVISVIESTVTDPNKSTYEFKVDKEVVNKVIKGTMSTVNTIVNTVLPNVGAGAAAGTVGAAVVKATANAPLGGKLLAIGASTGVTALATQTGLNIGASITKNLDLNYLVKNSPHVTSSDRVPSPDPFFVPSVLESSEIESPLEVLLSSQLTLNILIWVLLFSFLYLLFSTYVLRGNIVLISNLFNKYMPITFNNFLNKAIQRVSSINSVASDKLIFTLFIINMFLLIILLSLNTYVSIELVNNIESYVRVYNNLKGK